MSKTTHQMENASSSHSDLCGNLPPLSSGYEGNQSFTQASCASALLSRWAIYITKILCQLVPSPQATDCEQVSINEYTPFHFFSPTLFAEAWKCILHTKFGFSASLHLSWAKLGLAIALLIKSRPH